MLSLMNKAFEPNASYLNKMTYMTSINHLQSIHSDNNFVSVEKIKDLLTSSKYRLHGLQLLEIALQQNPDIYLKGRWYSILMEFLKESGNDIMKKQTCKIFCLLIPYMVKDPYYNKSDLSKFIEELFTILLFMVEEDCEWIEAACECVLSCMRNFSPFLTNNKSHKKRIWEVIQKQVTCSISSKALEAVADVFAELPSFEQNQDPNSYRNMWLSQYLRTLNSMQEQLSSFLAVLADDPYSDIKTKCHLESSGSMFTSDDEDEEDQSQDVYEVYMKAVRRYVNLCKCLAKMLSTQSKFAVEIPIKITLTCLTRLFQVQDMTKMKSTSIDVQIFCSNLSQLQIASLAILESLINFNLIPYSMLVVQLLFSALQASKLSNISTEPVSEIRLAIWIFLNKWISVHGNKVCGDIVHQSLGIVEELLKDISVEERESSQVSAIQASAKSKKNSSVNLDHRHVNKIDHKVCKEALKALENLIYSGANNITKKMFQDMFCKVSQVAKTLMSYVDFPFPYDSDSCRKNLYSVLLAFTVSSMPHQREPIQSSSVVFKKAFRDPSVKVTRFCHRAMAISRLVLHPKRPPVEVKDASDKRQNASCEVAKYPEWTSLDFATNLEENVAKISENINAQRARNFPHANENAMQQDEHMEEDVEEESHYPEHIYHEYPEQYASKYPEQMSDNQANGEDILEIMNSNQCQEDGESEDEDEEDDDERSYGEEDINEADLASENMCIPSTSKLHILSPLHIKPETVQCATEQEYDQVRHSVKTDDSSKSKLNGIRSIVPDDLPSTSTQSLANENGIDGSEEEDLEDEEYEEDEEEHESFPAEKKVPEFFPTPPPKKQKLETDEMKDRPQQDDGKEGSSGYVSLEEMKKSFCCDPFEKVEKVEEAES